jgi:glycosyltransferase involved in cell wall biosynthesis
MLVDIYNSCKFLICSSRIETSHLAGIEAAACGLPILATNVGAYYDFENGPWGIKISTNINNDIEYIFSNYTIFSPRQFFYEKGYDTESCKNKWLELINNL